MSNLAMPLLVLFLTGSAAQAGLVGSLGLLTTLACRLPAGVVAARFSRRTLLVVCDVVRLVAYLGLAGAVLAGVAGLPMIIVVTVVGAASTRSSAPRNTQRSATWCPPSSSPPPSRATRPAPTEPSSPGRRWVACSTGSAGPCRSSATPFPICSLLAVLLIRRPMEQPRTEQAPQSGGAAMAEGIRFVLANPFLRAAGDRGAAEHGLHRHDLHDRRGPGAGRHRLGGGRPGQHDLRHGRVPRRWPRRRSSAGCGCRPW
ncbi:hypothetical protein V2I01_32930 [Micromonospora sp. BRA006-A]|nr:hypothetical protein [Micromonospora sp. BRA006-A]